MKASSEMEVVSPLVRSIFEGRKKMILDAGQKVVSKKDGRIQSQAPQKDREHESENQATLNKKVQALDEEIAIFKKESKRVKNLAKVRKLVPFEISEKETANFLLKFFKKLISVNICFLAYDLHQILTSVP